MKRKYITYLLIFVASCLLFLHPKLTFANEIPLQGNLANDAQVETQSGQNVTGKSLDRYQYYQVHYQWSIPNNTEVQVGDTAHFYLPANVQILNDTSFPVTDQKGHIIGNFFIGKKQTSGTLTFNQTIQQLHMKQIVGTLTIEANGKKIENISQQQWNINKVGWLTDQHQPRWDIVYNPQQKSLSNVVLTDNFSPNQKIIVASIVVQYGYVDANNNFHAVKENDQPIQDGIIKLGTNGFTAQFAHLNKAIQILYTTELTNPTTLNVYNAASATANELKTVSDQATIIVGGAGSIDGSTSSSSINSSASANDQIFSEKTTSVTSYTSTSPQTTPIVSTTISSNTVTSASVMPASNSTSPHFSSTNGIQTTSTTLPTYTTKSSDTASSTSTPIINNTTESVDTADSTNALTTSDTMESADTADSTSTQVTSDSVDTAGSTSTPIINNTTESSSTASSTNAQTTSDTMESADTADSTSTQVTSDSVDTAGSTSTPIINNTTESSSTASSTKEVANKAFAVTHTTTTNNQSPRKTGQKAATTSSKKATTALPKTGDKKESLLLLIGIFLIASTYYIFKKDIKIIEH